MDPTSGGLSGGPDGRAGRAGPGCPEAARRDGAPRAGQVVVQVRFVGGLLVPVVVPMKPNVVEAPAASAPL